LSAIDLIHESFGAVIDEQRRNAFPAQGEGSRYSFTSI
jgi:hypothetical protein